MPPLHNAEGVSTRHMTPRMKDFIAADIPRENQSGWEEQCIEQRDVTLTGELGSGAHRRSFMAGSTRPCAHSRNSSADAKNALLVAAIDGCAMMASTAAIDSMPPR